MYLHGEPPRDRLARCTACKVYALLLILYTLRQRNNFVRFTYLYHYDVKSEDRIITEFTKTSAEDGIIA